MLGQLFDFNDALLLTKKCESSINGDTTFHSYFKFAV